MTGKVKPNFLAQFRGDRPSIIWGLRVFVRADGEDACQTNLMSNQDMGIFLATVQTVRSMHPQEKITITAMVIEPQK